MEDIAKYKRMPYNEFLEFIARLAQIKYLEDEVLPLEKKIEIVLELLLDLVGERVKQPNIN